MMQGTDALARQLPLGVQEIAEPLLMLLAEGLALECCSVQQPGCLFKASHDCSRPRGML